MWYTSWMRMYLTRSFRPFIFEGTDREALVFEHLKHLGLYVHIPFCKKLCSFCPYCKVPYEAERMDRYLDALLKEIDLVGSELKEKKQVTSLYFGGGTPALAGARLGEVIERLKRYFNITGGIGVELHPSDLSKEQLSQLKASGVTMISIGVQSFDEACLQKIGRVPEDLGEKMKWVREAAFDVVDIDLIFGIPGQDQASLEGDMTTAFREGATQLSTYPFIDFTFANNKYKPMSHKVKKEMLKELGHLAKQHHLARTAVWTFAKEGTERYSSVTRETFLGFGVSATTLLKDQFKVNTFSLEGYEERVRAGRLPTSLTLNFTTRQRAVYYLFWSAYSMRIDTAGFEEIVGVSLESLYGLEIRVAIGLGYLRKEGKDYVLTEKGAVVYHRIEQVYTTAYIDRMWHVSREVAFPERIVLR